MDDIFADTDDFATLRRQGGCYVDRTGFFEEFFCLSDKGLYVPPSDAVLFMRPRRFGKSLFLSMLAAFFDITKDSGDLFAGLRVAANGTLRAQWMNRAPVVHLRFTEVDSPKYEGALAQIHALVRAFCLEHNDALDSARVDEYDKRDFRRLTEKSIDEDTLVESLAVVTKVLACQYGRKAIVLVDDYDVPVMNARAHGYSEDMAGFMSGFMLRALKLNSEYRDFGVLTACLNTTVNSVCTGFNNLDCHDILSSAYADMFGFTQAEVDTVLSRTGLEAERDTLRAWYGGYRFGTRSDLYCPGSVLNYLRARRTNPGVRAEARLATAGGDSPVRGLFAVVGHEIRDGLASLLEGKTVAARIDRMPGWDDVYASSDRFWTFLSLNGFLTVAPDPNDRAAAADATARVSTDGGAVPFTRGRTVLVLPNREVRFLFAGEADSWIAGVATDGERRELLKLLWASDIPSFEAALGGLLARCQCLRGYGYGEDLYRVLLRGLLVPGGNAGAVLRAGGAPSSRAAAPALRVEDEGKKRVLVLGIRVVESEEELEAGAGEALEGPVGRTGDADDAGAADVAIGGSTDVLYLGVAFRGTACRVKASRAGETPAVREG